MSVEMFEHVWRFVETEQRIVQTKEGKTLNAYRVTALKERLAN